MYEEVPSTNVITTPTAEQIKAAQATLAQSAALIGNSTHINVDVATPSPAIDVLAETTPPEAVITAANFPQSVVEQDTPPVDLAPEAFIVIPADVVARLTEKFNAAMTNSEFFRNLKRVERLDDILVVPMFDDRSLQQFAVAANEELIKKAMELAIKTNSVPVMPTKDEIKTLALKKHASKQADIAEKAAKKNS